MIAPLIDDQILDSMQITVGESVEVRMATDDEGTIIRDLTAQEQMRQLDWSRVNPYWLVAIIKDQIVGAIHFALGLPIGRLEMLVYNEGLDTHDRSTVIRALILHGIKSHYKMGASGIMIAVPFGEKKIKKILRDRLGGEIIDSANIVFKGLRHDDSR